MGRLIAGKGGFSAAGPGGGGVGGVAPTLKVPPVAGKGTVPDMARAGLKKDDGGCERVYARHMPRPAAGGGGGGALTTGSSRSDREQAQFDGLTVADWIVPGILNWARGHGWTGRIRRPDIAPAPSRPAATCPTTRASITRAAQSTLAINTPRLRTRHYGMSMKNYPGSPKLSLNCFRNPSACGVGWRFTTWAARHLSATGHARGGFIAAGGYPRPGSASGWSCRKSPETKRTMPSTDGSWSE